MILTISIPFLSFLILCEGRRTCRQVHVLYRSGIYLLNISKWHLINIGPITIWHSIAYFDDSCDENSSPLSEFMFEIHLKVVNNKKIDLQAKSASISMHFLRSVNYFHCNLSFFIHRSTVHVYVHQASKP